MVEILAGKSTNKWARVFFVTQCNKSSLFRGKVKRAMQRSELTFSKSRLLATFNCKMVAIKRIQLPKKNLEGEDT